MRLSEKKAWARTCGVAWFVCHRFACAGGGVAWHAGGVPCARPCRKSSQDSRQMARMRNSGAFDLDCAADYSQGCPKHHVLRGGLCIAQAGCVCCSMFGHARLCALPALGHRPACPCYGPTCANGQADRWGRGVRRGCCVPCCCSVSAPCGPSLCISCAWPIPKRGTDLALRAHVAWPLFLLHTTPSYTTSCEASLAFVGMPCLRNTMPSRRLPMPRRASHHGGHDWGRWFRWAGVAVVGSRPCVDF